MFVWFRAVDFVGQGGRIEKEVKVLSELKICGWTSDDGPPLEPPLPLPSPSVPLSRCWRKVAWLLKGASFDNLDDIDWRLGIVHYFIHYHEDRCMMFLSNFKNSAAIAFVLIVVKAAAETVDSGLKKERSVSSVGHQHGS